MTYSPQFKESVARSFLDTNQTLKETAEMFGVSPSAVTIWAKAQDPDRYKTAKSKTRSLLLAQEIVDAMPSIKFQELSDRVGVNYSTIRLWVQKGYLAIEQECFICSEPTTTKYCPSCREKGWDRFQRNYGLTHKELLQLPEACEVCGSKENLHIDHDHETGKYRGVLCRTCNTGLGMYKDSSDLLIKASKYILSKSKRGNPL